MNVILVNVGSKFQEFDKWSVNTGPLNGNLSVVLFLMFRLLHNFWAFSYNFQVWEKFAYARKKFLLKPIFFEYPLLTCHFNRNWLKPK